MLRVLPSLLNRKQSEPENFSFFCFPACFFCIMVYLCINNVITLKEVSVIKTLVKHGNSMALVIERPVLELLGATAETAFEVVTDGYTLILSPVKDTAHSANVRESMDRIGKRYAKSFEELAK